MSKLDGQAQNAPINLEGMSDDELRELRNEPWVHSDVARMCTLLIFGRKYRLEGDITTAQRYEGKFENLYNVLPKHLRW